MSQVAKPLSLLALILGGAVGCHFVPEIARRPAVHNPFPQLSRVAIVEFFNGTSDDTVIDGFAVAEAYASELQAVPGFEVVPPDIVRAQLRDLRLTPQDLAHAEKRRQIGEVLGVDAFVLGVVTEYTPYYPPRLGLKVNWYATNPYFHPIPPGYGLPWATPAEEEIPDPIVFEAEMALARAQLATQTPLADKPLASAADAVPARYDASQTQDQAGPTQQSVAKSDRAGSESSRISTAANTSPGELPADWPDPRGLIPPPPSAERPPGIESRRAVMTHVKVYNGHDARFTAALRNYYYFRDEARFGGWQSYLARSDDFVRFCCHMHIAEMLSLRGGSGPSRLVWRWPGDR